MFKSEAKEQYKEVKFGFLLEDTKRDIDLSKIPYDSLKKEDEIFFVEKSGSEELRKNFFVVSNSKKVGHLIYAPEINFYIKNSSEEIDKLFKGVVALYKARYLKYLYSTDIPQVERISNRLLIVGSKADREMFKQLLPKDDLFEIQELETESVKSIEGFIGDLTVKTDENELTADQVVWFSLPEEFERVGVYDPTLSTEEEVIDIIVKNIESGYEYKKVIKYDPSVCQYNERKYDTCGFCADICPTGSIVKVNERKQLEIKQIMCTGCGGCVSICPSGALDYRETSRGVFHLISKLYRDRIPFVIPENVDLRRFNVSLKGGVLPLIVGGKKFLDESHFITLLQESGSQIILFNDSVLRGTEEAIELVNFLYMQKYGKKGIILVKDEDSLQKALDEASFIGNSAYRVDNQLFSTKREVFSSRISAIMDGKDYGVYHTKQYIHYGKIEIDESKCTLCLSCAAGCNVKALKPDPADNSLRFNASICTNCGYCEKLCPEGCLKVIDDVLEFNPSYFGYRIMAKDELFRCVECGRPFAPSKSVKKVAERMMKIWGKDDPRVRTLFCCPDCKPKVMYRISRERK